MFFKYYNIDYKRENNITVLYRKDCIIMAEYEKKVRKLLQQNNCYFVRRGKTVLLLKDI